MNIKRILQTFLNFIVPKPATVRRHRAPSARFSTLEALAKTHGDTLSREDGRGYFLVTAGMSEVLKFDNLAQVKVYLGEKTGLVNTPVAPTIS